MDPIVLKNLAYWEKTDLAVKENLGLKWECEGKSGNSAISVYDNEVT